MTSLHESLKSGRLSGVKVNLKPKTPRSASQQRAEGFEPPIRDAAVADMI